MTGKYVILVLAQYIALARRSGKEKIMTDLEAQILELYRQLPAELRKLMRLSAALSSCVPDRNDQKVAPAD